jgi:hypothetical protein
MSATPRVAVLMDYQNVHLTARDVFAPPGTTASATLVHPLHFGEQLLLERAAAQSASGQQAAVLDRVCVYRGSPSNRHEPRLYAKSLAQRAEWTRDPRVHVMYRTLRYPPNWPTEPAREKGIDVKLAIDLVRLADCSEVDVVILASHDTDLEPALEMATGFGKVKVETTGWAGAKRLRMPGRSIWHTFLDGNAYVRSRDRKPY